MQLEELYNVTAKVSSVFSEGDIQAQMFDSVFMRRDFN